jgi:glycosyltransferase involved in cell wall biosynthesis
VSIAEARESNFTYVPASTANYELGRPIFTVIIDCYYRLDLVRESVRSVLEQDYQNVELILVDNGAQPDVAEYVRQVHDTKPNVPLVTFAENQFSWDDIEKAVAVCWNAALLNARGDFVCHLAYDDKLSSNYVSRMVALFVENPACVTAAPLPVSIDDKGNPNESFNRAMERGNTRGRYTDGRLLALDLIAGNPNRLFTASGEILAIRKDVLLEHDGFDRVSDLSQVLKYAVLGDSGFDPGAKLYWRHHSGQLNRVAKRRGTIWYASSAQAWRASGIIELWREIFNADEVRALEAFWDHRLRTAPVLVLRENIGRLDPLAVARSVRNILRECPGILPNAALGAASELLGLVPKIIYAIVVRSMVSVLPGSTVALIRRRVRQTRQA